MHVLTFPELSLTGVTCGDLFYQRTMLEQVEQGLQQLIDGCPEGLTAVVGAPVYAQGGLYNCAVILGSDGIEGIVPQTYPEDARHFRTANQGEGCFAASIAFLQH